MSKSNVNICSAPSECRFAASEQDGRYQRVKASVQSQVCLLYLVNHHRLGVWHMPREVESLKPV